FAFGGELGRRELLVAGLDHQLQPRRMGMLRGFLRRPFLDAAVEFGLGHLAVGLRGFLSTPFQRRQPGISLGQHLLSAGVLRRQDRNTLVPPWGCFGLWVGVRFGFGLVAFTFALRFCLFRARCGLGGGFVGVIGFGRLGCRGGLGGFAHGPSWGWSHRLALPGGYSVRLSGTGNGTVQ